MKSFRFLSIILCTIIGISTYDANGMDTSRPRSNIFSYKESINKQKNLYDANEEKIQINDDILKDSDILDQNNIKYYDSYDFKSEAVSNLCSIIREKNVLTIDDLKSIKKELLEEAKFYAKAIENGSHYCEENTVSSMLLIFKDANELIQKLSLDVNFEKDMKSRIYRIRAEFRLKLNQNDIIILNKAKRLNEDNKNEDDFWKNENEDNKNEDDFWKNEDDLWSKYKSKTVAQLCSSIIDKTLTVSTLNELKRELLDEVKFYVGEAENCGYYGDVETMMNMSDIFDLANKLIKELLSDEKFYKDMESQINIIQKCIPEKGLKGLINYRLGL